MSTPTQDGRVQPELFANPEADFREWLELTLHAVDINDGAHSPKRIAGHIIDKAKQFYASAVSQAKGDGVVSAEEIALLQEKFNYAVSLLEELDQKVKIAPYELNMRVFYFLAQNQPKQPLPQPPTPC